MIIRIAEPVVTDGGQWEPPMPIGQHRTSAACEAISFISELPMTAQGSLRNGRGLAAYNEPLNLVCSFEDLHHLGLAHVPLYRKLLDVARPTEHLDCVGQ